MKVKVVYRNYIPLNRPYSSFITNPPAGIEFMFPKQSKYLKYLFPIYKNYRNFPFVQLFIKKGSKTFFDRRKNNRYANLSFYIGMIPQDEIKSPYLVDLEHNCMLFNNINYTYKDKTNVFNKLSNKYCKKIIPLSIAAKNNFTKFWSNDYSQINKKVEVVYPAIPLYKDIYKNKIDYSIVKKDASKIRLLFVGKESYRKGIVETCEAFDILCRNYSNIELIIVSNTLKEFENKYLSNKNIRFYKTVYTPNETITKFFLTCDIYVMPTLSDSLGMVYMEALSCGLPVVSTKQFAIPEIVDDGIDGFLINNNKLFLDKEIFPKARRDNEYVLDEADRNKIVENLVKKIKLLLENKSLRLKMSINSRKKFTGNGKFSIKVRNEKLIKIFKDSIKK